MRFALFVCAVVACVVSSFVGVAAEEEQKIKHVIVLVMENRAFDHMLGFLAAENPEINGCLPNAEGCSNPDDPLNPTKWTTVSDDAVYSTLPDPDHSIHGTTEQIYPFGTNSTAGSMQGFISSYKKRSASEPSTIMQQLSVQHVPIITQLAREFALVDGWFAGNLLPTQR
jgi:phospholipase C